MKRTGRLVGRCAGSRSFSAGLRSVGALPRGAAGPRNHRRFLRNSIAPLNLRRDDRQNFIRSERPDEVEIESSRHRRRSIAEEQAHNVSIAGPVHFHQPDRGRPLAPEKRRVRSRAAQFHSIAIARGFRRSIAHDRDPVTPVWRPALELRIENLAALAKKKNGDREKRTGRHSGGRCARFNNDRRLDALPVQFLRRRGSSHRARSLR